MKIPLAYGAFVAIASALLTLVLFLLGYHSDPSKLTMVQTLTMIVGITVNVVGIAVGIRARRAQIPPEESFTYGRAFGVGVLIGVFAALYGGIFNVLYSTVINPGFIDVMLQQQIAKLEEMGMSSNEIEKAADVMRMMFKAPIQFALVVLAGTFWSTIISLIAAAFLKRPASTEAPRSLPAI